jgi:enoyl-CoA hydratase/carnithine racemase
LLLLGEMVEADEALRLGLVTRVVDEAALVDETYAFARKMAKAATAAIGAVKIARNQGLGCDPVKGIEYQTICNTELMLHKDAREGPRAYLENREPNFTGEWIDLQYDPFVQLLPKEK